MESAALTRRGLSAGALKVIAILAMTADHIAWLFFPGYPKELLPLALHLIGRITCPIMCFFIAEGFHHTHDVRRYTARLFLFALLSHFAYRFAFQDVTSLRQLLPFSGGDVLNQTSVIWSLAFGLVMLSIAADPKRTGAMQALLLAEDGAGADENCGIVDGTLERTACNFFRLAREGTCDMEGALCRIEAEKTGGLQ